MGKFSVGHVKPEVSIEIQTMESGSSGLLSLQLSGEVQAADVSWGVSGTEVGLKAAKITKERVCLGDRFGVRAL